MKNLFLLVAFLMAALSSQAQDLAEPVGMPLIPGNYTNVADATDKMTLYTKDKQLWIKGDPANGMPECMNLKFVGNNTFTIPDVPVLSIYFEFLDYGRVKMTMTFSTDKGEKVLVVYKREK